MANNDGQTPLGFSLRKESCWYGQAARATGERSGRQEAHARSIEPAWQWAQRVDIFMGSTRRNSVLFTVLIISCIGGVLGVVAFHCAGFLFSYFTAPAGTEQIVIAQIVVFQWESH